MSIFANFGSFIRQHTILSERMALREKLLLQSDAVLTRKGYSRDLIETGLNAWPWQITFDASVSHEWADKEAMPMDSPVQPSDLIRQAAQALNRYNSKASANDTNSNSGSDVATSGSTSNGENRFAA